MAGDPGPGCAAPVPAELCCRCVSQPPARCAPRSRGHPHCVTRQRALPAPAALAYLLAASPSRPHRRPRASSALQSEGGRFVRAQEARQYFAAGAAVPGGRPSKGRDRGAARASFPYVRSQLVQKRGSPGPLRASSPPAGPPPGSAARAAGGRLSSSPPRRPLPAARPPAPHSRGEAPAGPREGSALGAQGLADGAGGQREASAHRPPPRPRSAKRGGSRERGSSLTARVPGLRRPAPPRGPWPRAHSGLGGGGGGTAAPSALGSRLGRGHPELRTPGRKGRARAGRRSQGGAGRGAAPPPRPVAPGRPREERRVVPRPPRGPPSGPHLHQGCAPGPGNCSGSGSAG